MTAQSHRGPHQPPAWTRADTLWFVAIFVLALVLRVVFDLQFSEFPLADEPHMDELIHHEWAQANLRGEVYWDGAYFRAPLYIWFVTAVYGVFGIEPLAVRLVQAGIGALTCGLSFLLARRAFGRAVGVVSGFLAATYWTLVYFDGQLMIPVLISCLDVLLLWLLLRTRERPGPLRWATCGLVLGLSAIARPNVLLFAPFIVLWQLLLLRPAWKRFVLHAACLTAGTLTPILPITARNWIVGDDFSLIATQGGVNWHIGNNPGSDGATAILPGDPADWWGCFNAQVARAEADLGRPLKGSEVSQYYARKSVEFWRDDPRAALALTGKKLGMFWTRYEIANSQDIYLITELYTPIIRWLPVGFWLVGPLGVLGLFIVMRRGTELFPLWAFVIVYMVSVVAFFVTGRYRVPVVHVLVPLSAFALQWLILAARARRFVPLAGAAVVLATFAAIGARVPGTPDFVRVQGQRTLGLRAVMDGDWPAADEFLSVATTEMDAQGWESKARIWFNLGYARQQQGKLTEALAAYERAHQARPRYPELAWRTAQVQRDLGDTEQAERWYRAAIERKAKHLAPRTELVDLLLAQGRAQDAAHEAQAGLAVLVDDPALLWLLARAHLDLGDPTEARRVAERGLEMAQAAGRSLLVKRLRKILAD